MEPGVAMVVVRSVVEVIVVRVRITHYGDTVGAGHQIPLTHDQPLAVGCEG
jgi:hypothetical protein